MDWEFLIILGWDVVGVIFEVGEGVIDWKVGDEVFVCFEIMCFGMYVEYIVVDDYLFVLFLEGISFDEVVLILFVGLIVW